MEWTLLIFLGLTLLLGIVIWIYEHPRGNREKKTGRGGDFHEDHSDHTE